MNEQEMLNNLVNMLDYLDTNSQSAVINWLNMFSNFANRKDLVIPSGRISAKFAEVRNNVLGNDEQSQKYLELLSSTIDNLKNNKELQGEKYNNYNKEYLNTDREEILRNLRTLSTNLSSQTLDIDTVLESVNNERINLGKRVIESAEEKRNSNLENLIAAKELEATRLKKEMETDTVKLTEYDSPKLTELYKQHTKLGEEWDDETIAYEQAHPQYDYTETDANNLPPKEYFDIDQNFMSKRAEILSQINAIAKEEPNIDSKVVEEYVKSETLKHEDKRKYEIAKKELETLKAQSTMDNKKIISSKDKLESERLESAAEILNHMKNNNYMDSQSFVNSIIRDYSNGVINSEQVYSILDVAKRFNKPAVLSKGNENIANLNIDQINSQILELSKQRINKLAVRDYLERSIEIEKKALPTLEKEAKKAKKELNDFNKTFNPVDNNKFFELSKEEQSKMKGEERRKKQLEDNLKNINDEIAKSQNEINEHKPDMLYQNLFDTADINEKLRLLAEQKRYLTAKKSFAELDKLCTPKVEIKKDNKKESKELQKEEKQPLPEIKKEEEKEEEKQPLPITKTEEEKEEKQPLPITPIDKDLAIKNERQADDKTKNKVVAWFDKNKKRIVRNVLTTLVLITVGPLAALGVYHTINCIANDKGLLETCGPKEKIEEVQKPVVNDSVIPSQTPLYTEIETEPVMDVADLDHPEDEEEKDKKPKPTKEPEVVITPVTPTPVVPVNPIPVTPITPVNPTPAPPAPVPTPPAPIPTPQPPTPVPTPEPPVQQEEHKAEEDKIIEDEKTGEEKKDDQGNPIKADTSLTVYDEEGNEVVIKKEDGEYAGYEDGKEKIDESGEQIKVDPTITGGITDDKIGEIAESKVETEPTTTTTPTAEEIATTQTEQGIGSEQVELPSIEEAPDLSEFEGLEELFGSGKSL